MWKQVLVAAVFGLRAIAGADDDLTVQTSLFSVRGALEENKDQCQSLPRYFIC